VTVEALRRRTIAKPGEEPFNAAVIEEPKHSPPVTLLAVLLFVARRQRQCRPGIGRPQLPAATLGKL
jgi:hypothetical protein